MKLQEYFNSKVRLFIRLFVPIEDNFKKIKIYLGMHYRVSEEAGITSLHAPTSINDVAKVFFTIEEFALWDAIARCQMLYQPSDSLVEEYKNSFLGFEFMDALKCRILLMILDNSVDNLHHLL